MNVTPGDPSCQNATVPGVSFLHEMQTLSRGGRTWYAADSGPAVGVDRWRARPREMRTKCVLASAGAQVRARLPTGLKQVYAPPRQIRVECMFLSPKRNQVYLGGIHLSPRSRQSAARAKRRPPRRPPAPQAQSEVEVLPRSSVPARGLGASKDAAPAPDGEGADAWHNMWAMQ